jgi:hypothetical protein
MTSALCPASIGGETKVVPEGATLAEVLETVRPGLVGAPGLHVFVDAMPVEPRDWDHFKPRAGQNVVARMVPQSGDGSGNGSKVLRSVLSIGLTALSLGVGGLWGAAIQVGGVLAIDALIPAPGLEQAGADAARQTPTISGATNRLNPYGPVPVILGKAKITPPLAAHPYTELDQSDQFLRMMVVLGYGPLTISDIKIGETPIENFDEVETEVSVGNPGDASLRLFPGTVVEESIGVLLKQTTDWVTRRTEDDIDEIGIEVTYPDGLIKIDDDGTRIERSVVIEGQYQEVGAGSWKTLGDALDVPAISFDTSNFGPEATYRIVVSKRSGRVYIVYPDIAGEIPSAPVDTFSIALIEHEGYPADDLNITDVRDAALTTYSANDFAPTNTPDAQTVQVAAGKFDVPLALSQTARTSSTIRVGQTIRVNNGQYDVRLRRTTADTTDERVSDEVFWTVLRSITNSDPVTLDGMAKVALRIKATDQLQGVVDQLNMVAQSLMPDWDRDLEQWVTRATSNPASAYRRLLQGPMNKRPIADARIDLTELQEWHEWCEDNGIEFNGIIDRKTTLIEALRTVAAVGRASPTMRDGRFSVVRDILRTVPRQLLTPKNSRAFAASKSFVSLPHAFKVQFVNGLPQHVLDVTPANVEIGDVFTIKFGATTMATFTATAATVANVTAGLTVAWDNSSERIAGFYDATDATTKLTLTANRPSAKVEFTATATNGGATDDQTLTIVQTSEDGSWERDEIIVYDDGHSAETATVFETLELFGVASPEQAWKDGRYRLAAARLRPETYSLEVDVEHLVSARGDLVRVQHDVPLLGLASGRVKSRAESGGNVTTITLDETVTMVGGSSYAVRYRKTDVSVKVEDVDTSPGETETLTFTTPVALADAPEIGDLVSFGLQGSETVEMIIQRIEMGDQLTAKLTLVDASPAIHSADTGTIPAFDPQITIPPRLEDLLPAVPEIVSLRSGEAVMIRKKDGTFENRIAATVRPGSGGQLPAARYDIQFRLSDATRWSELPDAPANATEISITPVEDGEQYDVRVRAVTQYGRFSDWDTVSGHTVLGAITIGDDFISVFDAALDLDAGTKVNCAVISGELVAPVNTTETWATHFTARSWTTIQDQIDAGYPYYFQPANTSLASWELKTDLGGDVLNARIKSTITLNKVAGNVTITPTISVSEDDIAYTVFAGTDEITFAKFRYVKVKYEFLAEDDTSYIVASEIRLTVDAKTRFDSATVAVLSTDSGGTTVVFGIDFTKVEAIAATPKTGVSSHFATAEFSTGLNPADFKLLAFDETGTRVSGDVSYVARGY